MCSGKNKREKKQIKIHAQIENAMPIQMYPFGCYSSFGCHWIAAIGCMQLVGSC